MEVQFIKSSGGGDVQAAENRRKTGGKPAKKRRKTGGAVQPNRRTAH
jgi:hypothetical protein